MTGASSEMGKATVEMLGHLEAKIYAIDINPCPVSGITQFIKYNLAQKNEIDEAFKQLPENLIAQAGLA